MAEPPFDVGRAHRWFAVELNNLCWELVEKPDRTQAENERMIHAAHAACFHWLEAGTPLNHLRAQVLLATAYAKAGLAEAAVRHAERTLSLSEEAGETQSAFDRATVHGCASCALAIAGRFDEAQVQYRLAQSAAAELEDAGEKQVFERLYP
ncbi:MAG TPA: hypothetical protein VIL86_13285, partial [Tepidisphaeraceae bacterium]